ncbi:hypothetical protein [Bradyrhizobium cosmicum]|uniref:hypothetical protein n=1 Tax=Bradyrhizobium cosmicum TaxID=1404864 RepID=UPI0028E67734|nr:hypothetical protein [Bradyrhizobium cosmicum]
MTDPHQVNTIICTTICAFFAQHRDAEIGIEEAKVPRSKLLRRSTRRDYRLSPPIRRVRLANTAESDIPVFMGFTRVQRS